MKKIIFTYLLWLTSIAAHSQFKDPLIIANTDYLELSNKQRKLGWKYIECSVVLITTGILLPKDVYANGDSFPDWFMRTGLLAISKGIILLVYSSKNKRKGMSLLLRKETVLQLQKNRFSNAAIPALSLKLNL